MKHPLSFSALFSISLHGLILLGLTGVVLFPTKLLETVKKIDLTIISDQNDHARDEKILESDEKLTQSIVTQGNAQWTIKPGYHNESAWKSLKIDQPRVRTVSMAAPQTRDIPYLAAWRHKIETVGSRYYQTQIKQRPLSGEVRVLVSIGPKGELLSATIRQSSGYPALDAIALEILKKTAPFEPLPPEIRQDTDVLEIMRTWKFTAHQGLLSG